MKESIILVVCLATLVVAIANLILMGQSAVEVAGVEVATTQPKT